MTLTGYDLSHYNATFPAGGDFYIVKATEGTGYRDPAHAQHLAAARATLQPVGHYHYATGAAPASDEAAFFYDHADVRPGESVWLDCEEPALIGTDACVEWCLTFLRYCGAHMPGGVGIYLPDHIITAYDWTPVAARYPLWVARYGPPPKLAHWPNWALWQYTDTPVDTSVYAGTPAQLRALFARTQPEPEPIDPEADMILTFQGKYGCYWAVTDDLTRKSFVHPDDKPAVLAAWATAGVHAAIATLSDATIDRIPDVAVATPVAITS